MNKLYLHYFDMIEQHITFVSSNRIWVGEQKCTQIFYITHKVNNCNLVTI